MGVVADRVIQSGALLDRLFGSYVHPLARGDSVLNARHLSLIASHVLGGALSAVVFAAYFAWIGAGGVAAGIASLCFISQLGIAAYLSRTGDLEVAHLFTAGNLTAIIVIAAALSGGSASFAVAWLALVPLEAALSADRRMMLIAAVLAVAALIGLHAATMAGLVPSQLPLPVTETQFALLTHLGAIAYAGTLAASIQKIHRSSQREIETSRELYRLIAENANDLITRHEATGEVTFASLASRSLFAVAPERLMGSGLSDLLSPEDRVRHAHSLTRCLAKGMPVSEEFRIEVERADGLGAKHIWVEMRCQPVGPRNGVMGAGSVIAVTRDISLRKIEADTIAHARDEAERASRAKTSFLATMSHELRTPLSAIIGFSELLHRDLLIKARDPKQADYCRIIHQSGEHLLSLVKDLLDVSKIESGKLSVVPEALDITEVAPCAMETLRPMAQTKGVALVCDIAESLPDVLADRRAVRQILINLVSNACKFTGAGGEVRLTAQRIGSELEIAVRDTGIGIAPEHIAKLGQPFYQIDTRYARENEGAGLGLSIVRGLLELQGGTLSIESEVGKGSRFMITLPIDGPAEEPNSVTAGREIPAGVVEFAAYAQKARAVDAEGTSAVSISKVHAGV